MGKKKGKDKSSKEEDCIDLTGPSCSHIRKGIDHSLFKRTAPDVDWNSCQDCQGGLNTNSEDEINGEPQVLWVCLKCGHRGCGRYSEDQHAVKHFEKPRSDTHCLVLNLDNWSVWCYICDDDVQYSSTGQLAQLVANIKKLAPSDSERKVKKTKEPRVSRNDLKDEEANHVEEEKESKGRQKKSVKKDASPKEKKTEAVGNSGALSVKGLSNLGNTCFFNAVVQNLSQTSLLRQVLGGVTNEKTRVTLTPSVSSELEPIEVQLDQPGSLTLSMWQLLNEIQETKKGVVTPRELFTQVCKKAARFKGFQQQDSQELLRYLLDGMRAEEIKRIHSGISEVLKSSGKNADSEESKTLIKHYEKNGAHKNFVDHVFGGEMTSTVMCKECKTVSIVTEMFLDLSLPVSDEAYRKKNQKKVVQRSSVSDDGMDSPTPVTNGNDDLPTGSGSKYQQKKAKKQAKKQSKNQRRQQKPEVKVTLDELGSQDEMGGGDAEASAPQSTSTEPDAGAETEEKTQTDTNQLSEVDHSEQGQKEMDDESKDEGQQQQQQQQQQKEEEEEEEEEAADDSAVSNRFMALAEDQSSKTQNNDGRTDEEAEEDMAEVAFIEEEEKEEKEEMEEEKEEMEEMEEEMKEEEQEEKKKEEEEKEEEEEKKKEKEEEEEKKKEEEEEKKKEEEEEEKLSEELKHLSLNGTLESCEPGTENGEVSDESREYTVVNQDPEKAFHTLATRTTPDKQECSVASCLIQFTEVEKLSQSNSLLCITCTKHQSASKSAEGAKKNVYRDALKQMLISSPPPVLTLHLKRFQQVGYSVCKVNRHVQFPQLLDLAPYCSVNCKNVSEGMTQVLYSLYGIVEHSGTMRSGHYTAYVKARPHCQNMASNGAAKQGDGEPPAGSWFYISDSSVQPVTEAKAQSSQAYLLFYERIS